MKVLLLSPYPEKLHEAFARAGDEAIATAERLPEMPSAADFIVSYGYRHILKEPHLSRFAGRIVNIHVSLLPWNRGADPNFWSWFDHTPKGVSIHRIDAGIDTGELLAQREMMFGGGETLRTSYAKLQDAARDLLADCWPRIRSGMIEAKPRIGSGSYHRAKDKEPWWRLLPQGHDTPVSVVEELGQ